MLSVKVITMRFDEVRGGYDDAVLNDFLRMHRVIEMNHHFFCEVRDSVPHASYNIPCDARGFATC
jgi:hypothetical protein